MAELIQRVRGTQDIYPREYYARQEAQRVLEECFERYGYEGMDVPIIEHLELHQKKSGDELVRHMYTFKDLGGRDLCLRPEITASVVRAYNLDLRAEPLPLKLFYFGPSFRYDKPQEGRYRQFTQAGVEAIGAEGPETDAEMIVMACDGITALGISNYICSIGSIGLMLQLLDSLGLEEQVRGYFLDSLEDLAKNESKEAGLIQLRKGLKERNIVDLETDAAMKEKIETVFDFISEMTLISGVPPTVFEQVEKLIARFSAQGVTAEPLEELKSIAGYLDAFGLDWDRAQIDFGFGRGLQYYTGMIFELHCAGLGAANQVAGGGRYDELIGILGNRENVPALGFAYGFERLLLAHRKAHPEPKTKYTGRLKTPPADVIVVSVGEVSRGYAIEVASELRRSGIKVELGSFSKRVKKLMGRADNLDIPYVAFIGEDELAAKAAKFRNMGTGEEQSVPFSGISDFAERIKES